MLDDDFNFSIIESVLFWTLKKLSNKRLINLVIYETVDYPFKYGTQEWL